MQATEFPKPYVKWSNEPARAQDVPAAIARAYYLAMQPPCGPTFVSIPVDDWDQRTELLSARQVSTAVRGDPRFVGGRGGRVGSCGASGNWLSAPASTGTVRGLWRCSLPSGTTHWCGFSPHSGRCSFPESHPLFAGFLPAGREAIVAAFAGARFRAGARGARLHIPHRGIWPYLPTETRMFQLVDDPDVASWLPTGTSIVTSLHLGIADLLDRPRRRAVQGQRVAPSRLALSLALQSVSPI